MWCEVGDGRCDRRLTIPNCFLSQKNSEMTEVFNFAKPLSGPIIRPTHPTKPLGPIILPTNPIQLPPADARPHKVKRSTFELLQPPPPKPEKAEEEPLSTDMVPLKKYRSREMAAEAHRKSENTNGISLEKAAGIERGSLGVRFF
jgi:hypothetical protein